eukprot:TRINITY_DN12027_c0_g1_i1.p1 TRINITY_DN12027_c0_g1~~TRINITY_DN12027_c0_g1_i1.p1  ORF type:complete len:340 (+),score=59.94 TRINITY_DN12027_c0_g1_i1:684-1703(+)
MLASLIPLAAVAAGVWNVTVEERVPPMVSQANGTSEFFLNCNPAFLTTPEGGRALIVRTQNCSYTDQSKCKSGEWGTLTPSKLVLITEVGENQFQYADEARIVFGPDNVGPAAAYGTEDPRIVRRETDGVYFLTFTAAVQPGVKTSYFATTKDPADPEGWTVQGVIPGAPGGAAILIRDDYPQNTTNFIFATDDGLAGALRIGTSPNLYNWTMTDQILIQGRPGMWDAAGVAAGPSPTRLTTGDYLFLYPTDNGKQDPVTGRCALGWVILSQTDPTHILARSDQPLMVATTSYEKDGWTPNVIFTTGIEVLNQQENEFMIYYGAADTVVAGARIKVHTP